MYDLEKIKETYSRMSDEDLMRLASEERQHLHHDAVLLLMKEFLQRKLDVSWFNELTDEKVQSKTTLIEDIKETDSKEFFNKLWGVIMAMKQKGEPNSKVFEVLIQEAGLTPEFAYNMIQNLPAKAKECLKEHTTNMQAGGILCILGFAVAAWLAAYFSTTFVLLFIMLGISGFVGFISNFSGKEKYKQILDNIKAGDSL